MLLCRISVSMTMWPLEPLMMKGVLIVALALRGCMQKCAQRDYTEGQSAAKELGVLPQPSGYILNVALLDFPVSPARLVNTKCNISSSVLFRAPATAFSGWSYRSATSMLQKPAEVLPERSRSRQVALSCGVASAIRQACLEREGFSHKYAIFQLLLVLRNTCMLTGWE